MNETTLQSAIRQWVKDTSGFDDEKVVWAEQDAVRLAPPFITLRLGDLVTLGAVDEVTTASDESAPGGQEMTQTVIGRRELPVTLQCFGKTEASAMKILSQVVTSLGLDVHSDPLEEAGISFYQVGPVQNVTALLETTYEPRALVELRGYVTEEVSAQTTYIQSARVTNEIADPDTTFDIGA